LPAVFVFSLILWLKTAMIAMLVASGRWKKSPVYIIINYKIMKLLIRLIINALALMLSPYLISGISVSNFYTALITAIVLGIVNAIIRPILVILTLPINMLTLGLFTLIINGLLILFVASFVKGFDVSGLWPAVLLSLFLWAVSFITSSLLLDR